MKFLGLLLILSLVYLSVNLIQEPDLVSAQIQSQDVLSAPQPIKTTSAFQTKIETETETLNRPITYQDNPDEEIGTDTTLTEGADGQKVTVVKIYFSSGQEYSREILSTEVTPPVTKIVSRGTKIVWRDLTTSDGTFQYWHKLRAWATSYDSHCPGCDMTTATGMTQGKGVIAVDPSVIKLGSKVYIPGYGMAIAGDTGGAIKGNIVDLGFEDTATSGWSSHFVDVYLLN